MGMSPFKCHCIWGSGILDIVYTCRESMDLEGMDTKQEKKKSHKMAACDLESYIKFTKM